MATSSPTTGSQAGSAPEGATPYPVDSRTCPACRAIGGHTPSCTEGATPEVLVVSECPPWCASGAAGHQQAYDEGCGQEASATHSTNVLGLSLAEHVNHYTNTVVREGGGHVGLELVAPTVSRGGGHPWVGVPLIDLQVEWRRRDADLDSRTKVRLTTSEARSLAAQLVAMADAEELILK